MSGPPLRDSLRATAMTRLGACVAIGVSVSYAAITSAEIEPVVADGGSVITSKGYTFETEDINEGASVRRSWVTLNDARCPLEIVEVALSTKGWRGDFLLRLMEVSSRVSHFRPLRCDSCSSTSSTNPC